MAYRLYSFVAHHYLSQLQCGLQTAHVVGELAHLCDQRASADSFFNWAEFDKTIIVCGASNQAGVLDAFQQFEILNERLHTALPLALFEEDVASMNSMATACGLIVPDRYYDAVWEAGNSCYVTSEGGIYSEVEQEFVTYLKSFRLA
jgi:hypothetical protein